jgi:hypothetical protein
MVWFENLGKAKGRKNDWKGSRENQEMQRGFQKSRAKNVVSERSFKFISNI